MKITVFGGSKPKPGEPAYNQALELGNLIGSRGHTVITGGYIGTMEAVSRGASLAGGHVIGITCDQIEAWRPVQPNTWIDEEIRYPNLHQRLLALIETGDAALALPGGPGTLAEIGLMWNLLIIGALPSRPLILLGTQWEPIFKAFYSELGDYVPAPQQRLLRIVTDLTTALDTAEIQVGKQWQ